MKTTSHNYLQRNSKVNLKKSQLFFILKKYVQKLYVIFYFLIQV